jgi:hypothetical protein
MSSYFDSGNSISQDKCALKLKDMNNSSMFDYNVIDFKKGRSPCNTDFYLDNKNLRCWNGYGISSPETIDCDSRLRYVDPKLIRGPDKQQLFTRTFHGVPDISSGTFVPDVESQLIHGHDSFVDKPCMSLTEIDFNRNTIFSPCVESYYNEGYTLSVNNDIRLGLSSRDMKQCPKYDMTKVEMQMNRMKEK